MRSEVVSPVAPDGERYLVGLVGAVIGTSPSPQLHGHEADELGLRRLYQLVRIDALGVRAAEASTLPARARGIGFRGLSITRRCIQVMQVLIADVMPACARGGWSVTSAGLVSASRRTWTEAEIQEAGGACRAAAASPELTARPGTCSPKPPASFHSSSQLARLSKQGDCYADVLQRKNRR